MKWNRSDHVEVPGPGTIHVWQAAFADWSSRLPALKSHLSVSELDRAGRFLREEDRDRYVFAHGVLRRILGGCCDFRPGDLQFGAGAHEKPYLSSESRDGTYWQFNLSHSGDRILVAVTCDGSVGVDVERCSRKVEVESLSRRFFSAQEAEAVLALPECSQKRVFMETWVCKEAFIKAVGEGLAMPLNSFSIRFEGPRTGVMCTPGQKNHHLDQPWTIERFSVAEDYFGAVAVPMRPVRITGFVAM